MNAKTILRLTRATFLAFLLLGMPTKGISASFDCGVAHSSAEKAICNSPTLSELDSRMAGTYRQISNQMRLKEKNRLKMQQKSWMNKRNDVCKANVGCLEKIYKEQIITLENWNRCSELSLTFDQAQNKRRDDLHLLDASEDKEGYFRYTGIDVDSDGIADVVRQSCGSRDMPCQLTVSLSTGGEFTLEEDKFYVAKDGSGFVVIVGDRKTSGRSVGAPLTRSVYQIKQDGINLICRDI